MKKLYVLSLVLVMAISLVSGTLALYTTQIDNLASGSVTAKEFIFTGSGTDTFQQGVKIAPSETVRWQFGVKNYENGLITETDLYYKLTFTVKATEGKQAIAPLTVTVKDLSGNVLKSVTGTGSFDVLGSFPLSQTGQERQFTVELTWPADGDNDINYAGGGYGTTVRVDAAASQLPYQEEPEQPTGDISVKYETTPAWTNGGSGVYEYNYQITITNNSDRTIEDWKMSLSLTGDELRSGWRAKLISSSGGNYVFENPAYNNTSTDDLLPGQSVTFGGPAYGRGNQSITNVTVGGSNSETIRNVALTCVFNRDFS